MITNERQYKITKAQAQQFSEAVEKFDQTSLVAQGVDPVIATAQRSSLVAQLGELNREIDEYEKLRSGAVTQLTVNKLLDIGDRLIAARIARGLSQRDLAERLEMKEQQIQRYEQERYLTANLTRIADIAEALGLEFHATFEIAAAPTTGNADRRLNSVLRFDPRKLPIREMKKRGWLHEVGQSKSMASSTDAELAAAFVFHACGASHIPSLQRQHVRVGGKYNEHSLLAWKARILQKARRLSNKISGATQLDAVFIQQLSELSNRPDGPVQAVRKLRERNVLVVFEKHLTGTHLDGAAMMLDNAVPVIGMTLRLDRLDNFWFVLLHELGHVVLHRDRGLQDGFFDDDSAKSLERTEAEADEFAQNSLIRNEVWKRSFVRFAKSRDEVIEFANRLKISPAIVAGRICRDRDYSLFPDLVGQGEVSKLILAAGLLEE